MFSFVSFADTEFPELNIVDTVDTETAYVFGSKNGTNYKIQIQGEQVSGLDISCCVVNSNDSDNSGFYIFTNISSGAFNNVLKVVRFTDNTNLGNQNINTQYSNYEYCYYMRVNNINYSSTVTYNCPVFDSLDSAFASYSNTETPVPLSGTAYVTVNPGCVAYILVDGGTADIKCTFPELSNLISRPMWLSGATYSFEDDLPSSGKVFSDVSGTLIDWLKPAEADTNLLGQTHVGARRLTNLPSGQYLVIYNPYYRGYDNNGVGIVSPSINVSLSNYGAVRQFRLTASFSNGAIISTSDDGYTSWFDSIGLEELNTDGTPIYTEHLANGTTQTAINVPSGGNIVSVQDEDTTIGGLIQRIVDFLSAPIKHIQNLFNSGVTFFNYLTSLFSWIPSEVTSVLVSALIVLLVVGVIKVLWK